MFAVHCFCYLIAELYFWIPVLNSGRIWMYIVYIVHYKLISIKQYLDF